MSARSPEARDFYHTEALRSGWSVRQLERQINSLFYERTAFSRNKVAMLQKGAKPQSGDALTAAEAIRDPRVLEFLNLRDEYSETELESALIQHFETFLLELGSDFTFVGRQRRLRIDDVWYRVDLLFFHRRLRCLVIVDLKLGKFTHADAGQMHLHLSYAKEHWTHPDENSPVGLILCSNAGENIVRYTFDTLPTKVMARDYQLALPGGKQLMQALAHAGKKSRPAPDREFIAGRARERWCLGSSAPISSYRSARNAVSSASFAVFLLAAVIKMPLPSACACTSATRSKPRGIAATAKMCGTRSGCFGERFTVVG